MLLGGPLHLVDVEAVGEAVAAVGARAPVGLAAVGPVARRTSSTSARWTSTPGCRSRPLRASPRAGDVGAQRPERRPHAIARGDLDARDDLPVAPLHLALGVDAAGVERARPVARAARVHGVVGRALRR